MSSHAAGNRRRRQPAHEEHVDERWLLTYTDMITLLMALFMVLWAISSVNIGEVRRAQGLAALRPSPARSCRRARAC